MFGYTVTHVRGCNGIGDLLTRQARNFIYSDSQVNSNFQYRWSPASPAFNNHPHPFLYLYIIRTVTYNTPHLNQSVFAKPWRCYVICQTGIHYKRRAGLEIRNIESIWIELVKNLFGQFDQPPIFDVSYYTNIENYLALAVDTGITDIIIT